MNRTLALAALPLLLALLGGCAGTHYASFVTKTSLAVLDVDSSPAEASIAFSRAEGYIGPRFDDGSVYPVTGFISARGAALTRETRQVFAGGRAAVLVLRDEGKPPEPSPCGDGLDRPPLFLATGTSVGVRLGFAAGTAVPNSFNFGYRRKEATLVPVSKTCQPSVLATHDSDGGARGTPGGTDRNAALDVTQYFATGAAADALARDTDVQQIFRREAKASIANVQAFKEREAAQSRSLLKSISCASAVPDAGFAPVLADLSRPGLLDDPGVIANVRAANGGVAGQRQRYVEALRLRMGDGDDFPAALADHEALVCRLAAAR